MNDQYYGPNAYDSTKITGSPRIDNSRFNFTIRKMRKYPLPRFNSGQCREYLYYDAVEYIEYLNNPDDEVKAYQAQPGHEWHKWSTMINPRALVEGWNDLSGILKACSIFAIIVMLLGALIKRPEWLINVKFLLIIFSPYLFFVLTRKITKYLIDHNIIKEKNNIYLNRRTGMVTVPRLIKDDLQIPFADFDAYLGTTVNPSLSESYHLWVCHRYSENFISSPTEKSAPWKIYLMWEFWQQYMDISKPLPDIPKMEPFRAKDPVTAAYDKANNRPTDYWKNLDLEKAEQMHDAAYKAAKSYPWGLSREQAIAHGWQPSGVGEGDWKQTE